MHSLRRRLKAQHEVIGTQSARLAQMQVSMEQPGLIQDYTTCQSMYVHVFLDAICALHTIYQLNLAKLIFGNLHQN